MVDFRFTLENIEDYDWMNIEPDEEVKIKTHPSIIPLIPEFIFGIISVLGILAGTVYFFDYIMNDIRLILIPIVALFFIVFSTLVMYLKNRFTFYVLTNTKIVVKKPEHGIFGTDKSEYPMENIQDYNINQPLIKQLLKIGDISVTTAGTGRVDLRLKNVPDPMGSKDTTGTGEERNLSFDGWLSEYTS